MICYMGAVVKTEATPPEEVHRTTYEILKKELGEKNYTIINAGDYRQSIERDSKAFDESLAFYEIKVFYILLISLFYKLGCSLSFSTVLPSLIAVVLIVLLVFFVLNRTLKDTFIAGIIAILLLFTPQMQLLARLSTPDALSTLFLLVTAVLFIYKSNWVLVFSLMLLSILTRTDNVIWCTLLLFLFAINRPVTIKKMAVCLFASLLLLFVVVSINSVYNNAGWEVLFYHSFIERQPFPLSATISLTLKEYAFILIRNTPQYLSWFLLPILVFYTVWKAKWNAFLTTRLGMIVTACALAFILKYLLFPMLSARYSIVFLLIGSLTFVIEREKLLLLKRSK